MNKILTKKEVENLKNKNLDYIHSELNREQRRTLAKLSPFLSMNNRAKTNKRGVLSRLVIPQFLPKIKVINHKNK